MRYPAHVVRRLKAGAGAALLVVFGLGVGLLLAEMCLRLLGISNPVFDTYDPDRGVKLRPGKRGWYRKEGNAFIAVNSLGYRDVEHLVRKPPGVYRIAFLGDSFTEARQVDIADTYWKLLESKLTSCGALAGRRVEALNFGVGGYGTAQELLTLRIDVLRLHPDLVVLAFLTGNDIANNSRALDDGYRPYFSVPGRPPGPGQFFSYAVLRELPAAVPTLGCSLLPRFGGAQPVPAFKGSATVAARTGATGPRRKRSAALGGARFVGPGLSPSTRRRLDRGLAGDRGADRARSS